MLVVKHTPHNEYVACLVIRLDDISLIYVNVSVYKKNWGHRATVGGERENKKRSKITIMRVVGMAGGRNDLFKL